MSVPHACTLRAHTCAALTRSAHCTPGTVEFDPELGCPVIFYTGVYLKSNAAAVANHGLPPPEHDTGTIFVERQLAAVPVDPGAPAAKRCVHALLCMLQHAACCMCLSACRSACMSGTHAWSRRRHRVTAIHSLLLQMTQTSRTGASCRL